MPPKSDDALRRAVKKERFIEEYFGCGCTSGYTIRADVLGYCKFHGGDQKRIIMVPVKRLLARKGRKGR